MIINLEKDIDRKRAKEYIKRFLEGKKKIELKELNINKFSR